MCLFQNFNIYIYLFIYLSRSQYIAKIFQQMPKSLFSVIFPKCRDLDLEFLNFEVIFFLTFQKIIIFLSLKFCFKEIFWYFILSQNIFNKWNNWTTMLYFLEFKQRFFSFSESHFVNLFWMNEFHKYLISKIQNNFFDIFQVILFMLGKYNYIFVNKHYVLKSMFHI